ncbi:MAG: response regulator [Ramlibacter sp.]|jgi:signal transduction histidine kinase/DNA-binding NarL/FixJ family response regulator|nr:response regulator [Ramlibacter sp.]
MKGLAGRTRLLVFLAMLSMLAVLGAAVMSVVKVREGPFADPRQVNWRDSVSGLVFGFEREYSRFRGELAAAARGNGPVDLRDAQMRYEILASRIQLLESTGSLDPLRNISEYLTLMARLRELTTTADALFAQPAPQRAKVRALLALTDESTSDVQSFTRAATVATAYLVEQQFGALRQQASVIGALAALQLLLAAAAGYLVWTQRRQEAAAREQLETLADELRTATHAADAANRTKSQFLANMSHELRTPFQGVTGMLQLLEQTQPTAAQQDLIRTARESADHLLTLLNDVLDVSAIEAGRVVLEEQPLNLHRLCRDVRQLMRGQAFARGLRLELAVSSSVPKWVTGDATRIKQVLFNLLSNAIKFTPSGVITLTVQKAHGVVTFQVTDTGIGMDEATLARLFRRFEMGDETLSRRFGGAGLGLEISRSLARMMGGNLVAQSTLGKGSIFTFTANLLRCQAPVEAGAVNALAALPEHALDVLVADDHPINRKYLALVLASMGHRYVLCEDGLQAVEHARTGQFDVVLMDIHMPGLDGLQATEAIRALDGPAARLPILVLTADVMPATRERATAAGVTACLHKPVQGPQLAEALNAAVNGPAAAPRPGALSSRFNALSKELPAQALAGLVDMFFGDESRTLADLHAALDAGEPRRIALAAHKLQGSARMLGFWRMAELAADIEKGEGQGPHKTRTPPQARKLLDDALAETRMAVQAARPRPQALPA